jgi:hypothetical protein
VRFICLGYLDESKWDALPEAEQNAMMQEFFNYDDVLRESGRFVGGESLQSALSAVTLRYRSGKVIVTDGPFAETKEQLGGIFVLETRDRNEAIELMSQHPGLRLGGPFEIRPANEEFNAQMAARRKQNAKEANR